MLTPDEEKFIAYWEQNRDRQKKFRFQWKIGLPLGLLLTTAIGINIFTGWYKRASMLINTHPSVILALVMSVLLILYFISFFSAQHRWEMNEQRYREFLEKKKLNK